MLGLIVGIESALHMHRLEKKEMDICKMYRRYTTTGPILACLLHMNGNLVLSTTSRARNVAGVNHIFFVSAVVTTEDSFFAILDEEAIPCDTDITIAVDRVFKLHYIMNLEYPQELYSFYVFLERCVFNIQVSKKSAIQCKRA